MIRQASRAINAGILLLIVSTLAGCRTGDPMTGLRQIGMLGFASSVEHAELETQRQFADALDVLEQDESFADTVSLARRADQARRDSEPTGTVLYAEVALACWPHLAASEVRESDQVAAAAWDVYHLSVAQFIKSASFHRQLDASQHVALANEDGDTASVPIRHQGFPWSAEDFSELRVAEPSTVERVERYWSSDGLGVASVALRKRETSEEYLNPLIPFAATCILRPLDEGEKPSRPNNVIDAVLELHDPLRIQEIDSGQQKWAIKRDLSAPLALATREIERNKLASFLNPGRTDTKAGLRMIEPYQPGKIPIVFVHGLLSDRFTWANLVNDLRSVDGVVDRYQIWSFQYPTGQPFIRSAAEMRHRLAKLVNDLDPEGKDEALSNMVLVGHSMGGLVSKLQVSHSESTMWDSVATRRVEEVKATPELRQEIDQLFFFEPSPYVKRVVFIGSPHRGSRMAKGIVGRVGSALVNIPTDRAERFRDFIANNPDLLSGELAGDLPSSIDLLRPDNPMLLATYKLRVNPVVKLHTIIGNGDDLSGGTPADGVVAVESARHPGTTSELLIGTTHTKLTGHEETTREMIRILGEHLGSLDQNRVAAAEPPSIAR